MQGGGAKQNSRFVTVGGGTRIAVSKTSKEAQNASESRMKTGGSSVATGVETILDKALLQKKKIHDVQIWNV